MLKSYKSSLLILGLSPFLFHCSQEAQVGSTPEAKLLDEYAASTKEYDNTRPTVLEATITGQQLTETSISLTWNKATDNSDGSASTALSYRIYMSSKADIATAEDMEANGTPLTEWTSDQGTIEITIPTLKKLNNLYVNILVQDEKGNNTPYTMLSLKNDSPFGELKIAGTKDGADYSANLTAHSSTGSLVYDAYLLQTANSSYTVNFANSDGSLTWNFDDLTLGTSNSITATKATNGKFSFDLTGGATAAAKVYRVALDASDKSAPQLLITNNKALLEVEFELRLKKSKIQAATSLGAMLTALAADLISAASPTFTMTADSGKKAEAAHEIYSEDLTNCTLKNSGYSLRQKLVKTLAVWNSSTAFPTSFTDPTVDSTNYYSVGLKGRSSDRNTSYVNNSTLASSLTADKSDEFTKVIGPASSYFERLSAFKAYGSVGCTTIPCTFSTVADVITKFPNTPNLSAKSSESLSSLSGTAAVYDAEYTILTKDILPFTGSTVKTKKGVVNLVYQYENGTATLLYGKLSMKVAYGSSPVESSADYAAALSKIQTVANAWAALSDWFETSDNQVDKLTYLYSYYNRCQ